MTNFRPTVEVLDARTLLSAVAAGADALIPEPAPQAAEVVRLAAPPSESAAGGVVRIDGKVAFQDFHFTQTGKVTYNDISIVKTVDKASPSL
jgi:hypothetical protein